MPLAHHLVQCFGADLIRKRPLHGGTPFPVDLGTFIIAWPIGNFHRENAKKPGAALHLAGLLSDGGVHSHNSHLVGLLDMAYELPVYQFNVFGGPEVEDVFLSKTEHVVATRWNKLFCDVIPAEGGKDFGVRATLERLGITNFTRRLLNCPTPT